MARLLSNIHKVTNNKNTPSETSYYSHALLPASFASVVKVFNEKGDPEISIEINATRISTDDIFAIIELLSFVALSPTTWDRAIAPERIE